MKQACATEKERKKRPTHTEYKKPTVPKLHTHTCTRFRAGPTIIPTSVENKNGQARGLLLLPGIKAQRSILSFIVIELPKRSDACSAII